MYRALEFGKKAIPMLTLGIGLVASGWNLLERWKRRPPPEEDEN